MKSCSRRSVFSAIFLAVLITACGPREPLILEEATAQAYYKEIRETITQRGEIEQAIPIAIESSSLLMELTASFVYQIGGKPSSKRNATYLLKLVTQRRKDFPYEILASDYEMAKETEHTRLMPKSYDYVVAQAILMDMDGTIIYEGRSAFHWLTTYAPHRAKNLRKAYLLSAYKALHQLR